LKRPAATNPATPVRKGRKAMGRNSYAPAATKQYASAAVGKLQGLAKGFLARKNIAKNLTAAEKNAVGRLATFGKSAIAKGFQKLARRF